MINKIKVDDIDKFYQLGSLLNSKFRILYDFNKLKDSSYDFIYGYYDKNELVGFIHINRLYENVDIVNIVVDEKMRQRGIASKLIEYVFEICNDVESFMLEVNENNMKALNLYKKYDFKEINRRKKYYGNDTAIIMKRDVQ